MAAPRIQLVLSESNVNIANNSSTVTATLYYYGNGETYNANAACAITIGGDTKNFTYNIQKYTNGIIGSHSVNFKHNTDGSLRVAYGASVSASDFYGPTKTSGTYTCKTIARATTPTLSPNAVKYGQNVTISLPRANTNFTHKLYYSDTKQWHTIASGVGTSYVWTVPKTLVSSGTGSDVPTRAITISVETYSGSQLIGTKNASLNVMPSDDMKPSVSITLSDPTGHKDKYGGYVRGQSKIKATISETLSYNAAIKLREIVIDGTKYNNVTTATSAEPISKLNAPVTATITDKRDMVGTASVKPTYLDWWQPKLTLAKVQRCTAGGTINEAGDHVRVDYSIDIAPLNNKNSKRIKVSTKKEGDQYWSNPTTVTPAGYKYQDYIVVPASSNYMYAVRIELSDDFTNSEETSTSVIRNIGTAFALMNWRNTGKGMAIGKVSEKDALEVALPAEFSKSLKVGNIDYTITDAEYQDLINQINNL